MAVKCIYHNMGGIDESDDTSMPYILRATLRVPEFMRVAALFMYGKEECTIIGDTEKELLEIAREYGISNNSRLIKMEITKR